MTVRQAAEHLHAMLSVVGGAPYAECKHYLATLGVTSIPAAATMRCLVDEFGATIHSDGAVTVTR